MMTLAPVRADAYAAAELSTTGEMPMPAFYRLLRHTWIVLMLVPLPALASSARVYVTNSAGDSVHVIDAATNKVVQVIKGIETPHGINFAPDGSKVYVSNESTSTLDVFDAKSGKLIKKVELSEHPNNIAVSKDGSRIFVAIARDPGAVDVIDAATLTRTKSIPVHGRLHNIYVTPDGKYLIAGSIPKKLMTVIDLSTDKVDWQYQFDKGVRPMTIETNPDGSTKRIFVQLSDTDGFAVVDFAKREEVARIKLPDLHTGVEMDAGRAAAPSHGIGVSPDGKTLWVTSIPQNAVFAYSLADLSLIGQVALPDLKLPGRVLGGAVPNWVTFAPDGKTVYISNAGLRSVSAVDTQAMKLRAVIPVGEVPKRINTMVMR
jgi:YVTN family beta-propeller protein